MTGGDFLNKGDEVAPNVPAVFPPLPEDAPKNRLTLARWLVSPENPLTARVAVNRHWEKFFGVGLVSSSEDFGSQGDPPSHPELLDWLASEFMAEGWSMKQLCKLIVTSQTYQQSSKITPEMYELDRDNRLLARGPRFRLEAEMIRDQALAAAGLLSHKMYGPSVMPPQPDGLWQLVYSGDNWQTSEGEDRYRRGIYTFWRRTSPHPAMMAFDATSREVCTVRRISTNTPLQALVTLNDPEFVEAAQALARLTVGESDDIALCVDRAVLRVLCRPATAAERERLVALYQSELEHFQANQEAAYQMAGLDISEPYSGPAVESLAAWTVVGNVLLNLDETLTKD
jgi:hypothetical protein